MRRIDNPQSGEHMEFQVTADESRGELLRMELVLDPSGLVAAPHLHPQQEERFEVLEGTVRFRIAGVEQDAHPGEVVTVDAGTPHVLGNPTDQRSRMIVEFRPALRTQEFLETLFAWVNDGKTRDGLPTNPLRLAVMAREYRREIRPVPDKSVPISRLPGPLLDGLLITFGGLGRLLGYGATPPPAQR